MSVLTLNPTSTIDLGGATVTNIAGTGAAGALADNSDASYVELAGNHTGLGFPTPSLTAGSKVNRIFVNARLSSGTLIGDLGGGPIYEPFPSTLRTSILGQGGQEILVNWVDPTEVSGIYVLANPGTIPTWELDLKRQDSMLRSNAAMASELRIYKVYIQILYVKKPVVTVTAPTGTITNTSFPLTTWTVVSDDDGGPLDQAEVKIFNAAQYGASGFSAGVSTPVAASGLLDESAANKDVVRSWRTTTKLPGGGGSTVTYRAYVRTRQSPDSNWSDWTAYSQFTQDVTPPANPTSVTATAENDEGRMRIDVVGTDSPTVDAVEIERATALGVSVQTVNDTFTDADGTTLTTHTGELGAAWTPKTPGSGKIASNRWHPDGAHRQLYASAVPTSPYYSVFGIVRRITGLTNGNAGVMGRLSAGADDTGYEAYWGTGGTVWTLAKRVNNTITTLGTYADDPGNGVNRTVELRMAGTSIKVLVDGTERISVTDTAIPDAGRPGIRGNTGAATTGIHLDSVWVEGIPYGDWEPVRSFGDEYMGLAPVAGDATAWDWEAPIATPVRYRARALHLYALGEWASSDWVQSTPSQWESGRWWIKHPTDWTLNKEVHVRSQASYTRPRRQGVFVPLGRSDPVVVSDGVRTFPNGEIVVRSLDITMQAQIDALADEDVALLIQAPVDHNWPDRWVKLGDLTRERIADGLAKPWVFDTFPWQEVVRPEGTMESLPVVPDAPSPAQGHLRIPFTIPDTFR